MIKKINIGLAISRNFDKVTIDMLDEPVNYENEEELRSGIRKRFKIIREEIAKEFKEIQK